MLLDGKQFKTRSVPLAKLAKDMFAVELPTTFTVAGTTLADVTGMSFALRAGATYRFEFDLLITSTAVLGSTIGLSVNYSGTLSRMQQGVMFATAANAFDAGGNTANNTAITDGSRGASTALPAKLVGSITTTTAGTLTLRAQRSAATVTLLAGASATCVEI